MPLLERLLRAVRRSNLTQKQEHLNILWHAGEPLAAGIDYFEQALDLTERLVGDRWRVRHSIQTNGTLITEKWCDLFRARALSIGVSLDGPAEFHDENRKTRGGGGSFEHVMRGIELLRANNIGINVLCVLSTANISHPDEMFHFFMENDMRHIAFNVEEIEGPHLNSSLMRDAGDITGARALYATFMGRIAQLNKRHGWRLGIREFDSLAGLIQQRRECDSHVPVLAEQRLGAILTMTRDGIVYSWSPELASGTASGLDRFALGRIRDVESIDELLVSEKAIAMQREIDRGIAMCSQSCNYFGVCGGGSPGNKFYERGTFATTETLKCALQTQTLTEVLLATFSGS